MLTSKSIVSDENKERGLHHRAIICKQMFGVSEVKKLATLPHLKIGV
jgi:hypothetical protein